MMVIDTALANYIVRNQFRYAKERNATNYDEIAENKSMMPPASISITISSQPRILPRVVIGLKGSKLPVHHLFLVLGKLARYLRVKA